MQEFIHLLQAAVLGVIQGVTEFLPISSTGHLIIGQRLFGLDQQVYGLAFDMATNLGTLVALYIFFWKDILTTIRQLKLPQRGHEITEGSKTSWRILAITIVVAVIGFLAKDSIEGVFRSTTLVAIMLVIFGIYMLVAERLAHHAQSLSKPFSQWAMGLSQAIALIPGVSRSGITISTGLITGMNREQAARFSFLLSAPITTIAVTVGLIDAFITISRNGATASILGFYIVGFITALISGYWAISFLLRYLQKASLAAFAYYRFALAAVLLLLSIFF
jgi:undecaprenyl-diphosphatase